MDTTPDTSPTRSFQQIEGSLDEDRNVSSLSSESSWASVPAKVMLIHRVVHP